MPAFADPRDFNVVNGSSIVLTHVFVSPSDTQEWGEDIMGRDVLSPAETVNVTFGKFDGNSCLYDVKVVGQADERIGWARRLKELTGALGRIFRGR